MYILIFILSGTISFKVFDNATTACYALAIKNEPAKLFIITPEDCGPHCSSSRRTLKEVKCVKAYETEVVEAPKETK